MTRTVRRLALASLLLTAALSAQSLAPGVLLISGGFAPGTQPDGNTLLLEGTTGWIAVDSGRHVEHARAIVDRVKSSGRPLVVLVNTHWHLDHTGGNALLRREFPGLRVLASGAFEAAEHGFLADYRQQLEVMLRGGLPADRAAAFREELSRIDAGAARAPDEVVVTPGKRELAGRPVELGLEPHAATAGDVWLLDLASRTLAAGDLVTFPVPFLDTACPTGWAKALDRLVAVGFERLVPGHGAPLDRQGFATYRRAFGGLLACAATTSPVATCADRWIADLGALLPAAEHPFTRELLDYYVGNVLRGDPAAIAARCAD